MKQTAVLMAVAAGAILATASRVLPQIQPDYEGIPAPLEKAVDATDVIIEARLVSLANLVFEAPVIRPEKVEIYRMPTTAVTVDSVRSVKSMSCVHQGESTLQFRRAGFTADPQAPPDVKDKADMRFPTLHVGRRYVFFLECNQANMLWLAYGPQGIFEDRNGTVWTSDVLSLLARRWNGARWSEFIEAIEKRVKQSNKNAR